MHACGHDGHTAILAGTAAILAELSRETPLPRPVTLLFQPAEEGGGGARFMIEDGALDGRIGPPPTRIYGLHGWPGLPVGVVATRPGAMLASADRVEIEVRGGGTHAAMPHLGRDPILAAAQIVVALQSLVARETDPLDSAVVSITTLSGGNAFNVIPERVDLAGTLRCLRGETRRRMQRRIEEIAKAVAAAHRCEATVRIDDGYPVTSNDPALVARFEEVARAVLGADAVATLPAPIMGAEDFSFYGERIPACFFALGLEGDPAAPMPPLHSPRFDFNDEALPVGLAAMCGLALHG
jgi:amidohydrolase